MNSCVLLVLGPFQTALLVAILGIPALIILVLIKSFKHRKVIERFDEFSKRETEKESEKADAKKNLD